MISLLIRRCEQNQWLDSNADQRTAHIELTEFTVNEPCWLAADRTENKKLLATSTSRGLNDDNERHNDARSTRKTDEPSLFKRTYHVETKTGKKGFLGLSPTGKATQLF